MTPTLTRLDPDRPAGAAVLLLHGGTPRSETVVDGRSASWRRMAALQRAVGRPLRADGVASWLLRYRQRGWNDGVGVLADARWALEEVRRTHGDVPVVLLGHSMGARVAVHVADDPSVVGVVGLAPWWEPGDPVSPLAGRRLVAAHGRRDRITSFRRTADFVERARRAGVAADLVDMGWRGHYLLAGAGVWNRVALDGVRSVRTGSEPTRPTAPGRAAPSRDSHRPARRRG